MTKSLSRDERDQASKLIGDYLLKGYTMLDEYCPTCTVSVSLKMKCQTSTYVFLLQSPMMRRRQEDTFCVVCRDVTKCTSIKNEDGEIIMDTAPISSTTTSQLSNKRQAVNGSSIFNSMEIESQRPPLPTDLKNALQAVIAVSSSKLMWASEQLQKSFDVPQCIQLNQLIEATVNTLEKVYKFQASSSQWDAKIRFQVFNFSSIHCSNWVKQKSTVLINTNDNSFKYESVCMYFFQKKCGGISFRAQERLPRLYN